MDLRTKLGALMGAGGLLLMAASAVFAAPPTYFVSVDKSANPASVPPSGGDVEFTIVVTATGTGFFNSVVVDDGMAGCTLAGPFNDDGDGKLEPDDPWTYTCTVTGLTPGAQNTVTVNACHDQSECVDSHDATDFDTVTLGEGDEPPATDPPATDPPATDPPATDPPDTDPSEDPDFGGEEQGAGDGATQPATDTSVTGGPAGSGNTLMLVIALGMLLASVVLVTPARPVRER